MINAIEIRNYKCFQHVRATNCRRINILVGDNGAGKTAFLEAIFLALAGNAQVVLRNRQSRGLDGQVGGTARAIEDALWGDLFFQFNTDKPISVILSGTGIAARSFFVTSGPTNTLVPLENTDQRRGSANFHFTWKDHRGTEYDGTPIFTGSSLSFPPEKENLPGFFYFHSSTIGQATENAGRFSQLSRSGTHRPFIDLFTKEYPWIKDLSIEVIAGQPAIHATLQDLREKIPLNSISSGINRLLSILLAMASQSYSVIVVDEIENGLYYKHHASFWRWLMSFSKAYNSQLFLSSHSAEWLDALTSSSDEEIDQVALWRLERDKEGIPVLRQMKGRQALLGIRSGGVR